VLVSLFLVFLSFFLRRLSVFFGRGRRVSWGLFMFDGDKNVAAWVLVKSLLMSGGAIIAER